MRRVAVIAATWGDADPSANCNLCHVEDCSLATPHVVLEPTISQSLSASAYQPPPNGYVHLDAVSNNLLRGSEARASGVELFV